MTMARRSVNWSAALLATALDLGLGICGAGEARQILDAAGVKGGLVVHLGCGDGALTAALRADAFDLGIGECTGRRQ